MMDSRTPSATAPPTSSGALRVLRLRKAASLLLQRGPLSRTELARQTGYSPASMTATIRDLSALGLVHEAGRAVSTGGRPASLIEFDRTAVRLTLVSAVDTLLVASQIDLAGNELVRIVRDVDRADSLSSMLDALATLEKAAGKRSHCIALSVPGVVSPDGTVSQAPSLGDLDTRALRQAIERAGSLPVLVENDVNLLALGEASAGAAQGGEDFALIYVGAGIGGAFVQAGSVLHGAQGSAGELGFLPYLGQWAAPGSAEGPFEAAWSVPALRERVRDEGALESLPLEHPAVGAALDAWSFAALVTAAVVDPAKIVFAGEVCALPAPWREELARRVGARLPRPIEVSFAALGTRAVPLGVIELVAASTELFLPDAVDAAAGE